MPLTLRAPPASKFVPDKFVSAASLVSLPDKKRNAVKPQANTKGALGLLGEWARIPLTRHLVETILLNIKPV
ncbi:hypothetical protein Q7A_03235 [Methylophaga nitratireducenticrescens]|nr:hypothetical protein Q7A_03235 [Methylophaga nitratireducenticrescens]AUZ83539.1 hypothetical protein CDW43_02685 [Methylophaga nitratireducenticrescens]